MCDLAGRVSISEPGQHQNQDSRARTKVKLVSPASARAKLDPLYSKLQAF